jgi:ABC-type cobalamin transport system ATPase subunit
LRSLGHRRARTVAAVDGITFEVQPGEVVGFLGSNGAGKTTTLKMLSGLLYPTAGDVSVLGHIPWRRNSEFLRQITLVMGQRNQLNWDIPVIDSFELNRRWMVAFPVDVLLGHLTFGQALVGIAVQGTGVVLSLALLGIAWGAGLRRYSAVGA